MFAERDNTTLALEYAHSMLGNNAHVTTAIMVYHNTLIETLARIEDNNKEDITCH